MQKKRCLRILFSCIIFVLAINVLNCGCDNQAEKLKIAKKECFKAYKTLKKIEAMLEGGVTLQNYSLAVNDAKFELNMISANFDKTFTPLLLTQLEEIFHFYQLGKTVWGAEITAKINSNEEEEDLHDLCKKIMYEHFLNNRKYTQKMLGYSCYMSFSASYKPNQSKYAIIYDCSAKLRQMLWIEASKRIREYEKETLQS